MLGRRHFTNVAKKVCLNSDFLAKFCYQISRLFPEYYKAVVKNGVRKKMKAEGAQDKGSQDKGAQAED